jgi:thiol:disulfide interchange protein
MHRPRILLLALALVVARPAVAQDAAAVPAPPAGKPARPAIYDEQADAHQQIATALLHAKKENRRVLIQWGGNWCGWCHLLHELCASDEHLKKELQYEYDVVLVDIGHMDKNTDLTTSYGADLKANGVPYLTILDADGKVLANQETGALETGDKDKPGHDPAKVLAFLTAHQAAYLKAEDLRRDALAQAAKENKRVFLHFGAPWCGWCHKLEDWMAREPASSLLPRDFVDCKIDVDRTVGGAELLASLRSNQQGGIPWFAFLAADGSVLATSDGPAGNTGFPAKPDEIAHFTGMLQKASVKLDAEAIGTLAASLQPAPGAAP